MDDYPKYCDVSVMTEIRHVVAHEIKELLLSLRSILFFVVYGGMSFIVGSIHGKVIHLIDDTIAKNTGAFSGQDLNNAGFTATEMFRKLFEQSPQAIDTFGGQEVADALMDGSLPIVVLVVMFFSSYLLPSLILIIGFDRISQDLNGKFSRYIFLRLRRGTYLVGKIAAQWLVALVIVVSVHAILIALAATHDAYLVSDILRAAPKLWIGMTAYLLAYIAFTALFSSVLTPPFAALALGLIALMGFGVLSFSSAFQAVWIGDTAIPLWVGAPSAYAVYLAHIGIWGGLAFNAMRMREI